MLPSCKQFIECRVRSTVIKHTAGHVAFWPQPVGSLPLAQNAWHCTSWASGSEPTQSYNRAEFLYIYIYIYIYIDPHRANVKPAHCKFKGRTFSANFSPLLTQHTPVFFLQLYSIYATTDHPCAWTMLTPAEPLSVWTSPHETTTTLCVFYGESYAIQRPCCPPVIECRVRSTVIIHKACGFLATTSGIAPARPKCVALH